MKPNRQYYEALVAERTRQLNDLRANIVGTEGEVRREIEAMIRRAENALRDAKDDLKEFDSNPDNK